MCMGPLCFVSLVRVGPCIISPISLGGCDVCIRVCLCVCVGVCVCTEVFVLFIRASYFLCFTAWTDSSPLAPRPALQFAASPSSPNYFCQTNGTQAQFKAATADCLSVWGTIITCSFFSLSFSLSLSLSLAAVLALSLSPFLSSFLYFSFFLAFFLLTQCTHWVLFFPSHTWPSQGR